MKRLAPDASVFAVGCAPRDPTLFPWVAVSPAANLPPFVVAAAGIAAVVTVEPIVSAVGIGIIIIFDFTSALAIAREREKGKS